MLKLKLPYYGHLMRRVDSLEKSLTLGGIRAEGEGDDRGWDGWMASPTRWTWVWVNFGCWWWTGSQGVLRFMGSQRVGQDWETELNRSELNLIYWIIDFQGTCDLCCYYVLWLRSQTWIGSQKAPSLTRNWKFKVKRGSPDGWDITRLFPSCL